MPHLTGPWLLALLPALFAPAPGGADARAGRSEDGSLEQLLREVRRRREAAAVKLAEPVRALLQRLEQASPADKAEPERVKAELIALGTEAAPLLVPHIDPGPEALAPEKRRAALLADVLEQLPTRSVTEPLVALARTGSPQGRANALRVLGTSPDRAPAGACLIETYRAEQGELRIMALRSLARLGGPEHEGVLVEALGETDPDVLRAVLTALAAVRSTAGRERVRALAGAPLSAALVEEIVAYLRAISAQLGPEDYEALARLAGRDEPSKQDQELILQALGDLQPELDAKLRKLFDPLLESPDEEIRTAAQLCLARLGDRNERRDLVKRFNDLVASNEDWAGGYEQRGAILLRLGEHAEAAKDYTRAIKIHRDNNQEVPDALFVSLARALVLDQNLRKAHEALTEGGLSRGVLKQLATDPDFQALVEHTKYGRIFDP